MGSRKVAAEVEDVGYSWNEIKTVAMSKSEWNQFIDIIYIDSVNNFYRNKSTFGNINFL